MRRCRLRLVQCFKTETSAPRTGEIQLDQEVSTTTTAESVSSNSRISAVESFEHRVDHGEVDEGFAGFQVAFTVLAVAA